MLFQLSCQKQKLRGNFVIIKNVQTLLEVEESVYPSRKEEEQEAMQNMKDAPITYHAQNAGV